MLLCDSSLNLWAPFSMPELTSVTQEHCRDLPLQYRLRGSRCCLCAQFFAKCGILKEDDDGKPRVKLYKDRASGMLKGDGLVYYLKQPSVSHQNPLLQVWMCNAKYTSTASLGTRQTSNMDA